MPKVSLPGSYRFYFFSNEPNEPSHIHVKRERAVCKFWLNPIELAENYGFATHELNKIEFLIEQHWLTIESAWHEYFQRLQ
jgi:hypothetical protein